ncbi:MAG TPA: hypothetical protein PKE51_12775, partial [Gemmatimonadaceae bacterium]|nr:hypothetical protein [Gemmatimonadaceae bacterium]
MLQSRGAGRVVVWALMAGLSAACGGGDGGGTPSGPAPVPGTLTVAVTPSRDSVQAGATKSAAAQIGRGGSFTGAVTLAVEGAPAGVSVTPASTTLAAGTTSSSLTIAVDSSTTPGAYPITVRASGAGVSAATATYQLTVTAPPPPAPDFRVELAQTTFSVQQGDSIATPVIVRRLGGLLGDVGIFVSSAPLDVQVRLTPPTVSDTLTSLSIAVPVGVPAGTYPMVLIATSSGGIERTVNLTLVVTPKPTAGVLTLTPSQVQVTQTVPSDPILVRLARPAGLTGPIALSLENLPVGFAGTFTPNPAGGDSAQLVLTLSQLAPAGVNTIRVRATVGGTTSTADLVVTSRTFVPPDFAVRLSPTVAAVTAGNDATATVEVVRTNFTDPVALTVSGLPFGMTATVTPPTALDDSAQLTISTAAS